MKEELQLLFKGILRDYQIETIYSILNYYINEGNNGNVAAALPTGTGKTPIISGLLCYMLWKWPNLRFMVLSHVKSILDQNYNTLRRMWETAPCGLYSAGLNQKETSLPIIIGGIASVVNNVSAFGFRDILIVDEAHLISPDENTMYQKVIKELKNANPNLIIVALSATLYRLGMGMITEGDLIDDIVIDLTTMNCFNRFIKEGYLAPLIPKRTNVEIDTSEVKIIKGDFATKQLDAATEKVILEALKESMLYGQDRNCWLVFCSGIKPSEHAAEILQSFGIAATAIHSKLTDIECDKRLEAFKKGEIRALVGNNKFTTGFDFPPIDFCIMLRPTMSPGLWVQMLGRLTRPYDFNNKQQYIPGFEYVKQNALVLDFAGNTRKLGPINDVVLPRKKGDKVGDAPIKICDKCGVYNHASARVCCACGVEFEIKVKITKTAGTDELLRTDASEKIEKFDVSRVIYHRHTKIGSQPSIKVSYYCGLQRYTEYSCPEHKGYARSRFIQWWQQRHESEPPSNVDDALIYASQLRCPKQILVRTDLQYPEIRGVIW